MGNRATHLSSLQGSASGTAETCSLACASCMGEPNVHLELRRKALEGVLGVPGAEAEAGLPDLEGLGGKKEGHLC